MKGKYMLVLMDDMKAVQGSNVLDSRRDFADGAAAAVCAGGNREAVGSPGNGGGRSTETLRDAVAYKEEWDEPGSCISDSSLSWVSDSNLKCVLEEFVFDIDDISKLIDDFLNGKNIDFEKVRSFFMNDYLRCRSLCAELEYRLNKL